jgi:hypothetical protein
MIMRRFSEEGDVGRARELVAQVSQSDEQYIYAFYLICIVGNPQLITLNTSHLNVSILREDFLANYRNYHFSV